MDKDEQGSVKFSDIEKLGTGFPLFGKVPWSISDSRVQLLASRLGIPADGEWLATWASIGMALALKEREFSVRRGRRGRMTRKEKGGGGRDYLRYLRLRQREKEKGANNLEAFNLSVAIDSARDDGEPLFQTRKDALANSVSRGKKVFEDARRESQKLTAKCYRNDCVEFRKRCRWITEAVAAVEQLARLDAEGPTHLSILSPRKISRDREIFQLEQKLYNPFFRIRHHNLFPE